MPDNGRAPSSVGLSGICGQSGRPLKRRAHSHLRWTGRVPTARRMIAANGAARVSSELDIGEALQVMYSRPADPRRADLLWEVLSLTSLAPIPVTNHLRLDRT